MAASIHGASLRRRILRSSARVLYIARALRPQGKCLISGKCHNDALQKFGDRFCVCLVARWVERFAACLVTLSFNLLDQRLMTDLDKLWEGDKQ